MTETDTFPEHRPLLFSIAYRMLGPGAGPRAYDHAAGGHGLGDGESVAQAISSGSEFYLCYYGSVV